MFIDKSCLLTDNKKYGGDMKSIKYFLLIILCVLTVDIFSEDFELRNRAFDIQIRTKSYNDYYFIAHKGGYADTIITVLGWSRDGKMLYEALYYSEQNFYIINLIDDKIVWDAKTALLGINKNLIEYNNEELKTLILSSAKNFNIEPIISNIGEFPYKENNREYYCFASKDRKPDPKLAIFEVDKFVKQLFTPNKMKMVNTIKNRRFRLCGGREKV